MRYNSMNRRLQKKSEPSAGGGVTTDYVRDQDGNVLAVYEDGTLVERYVWGPLGLVKILKGENGSTTPYFVVNDHLGYARAVVSAGGTAVAAYDCWPYGKSLRSSVDANCDSRFQFGAKEYDDELGLDLYYFEARCFNPEIGRFVSPDPLRQAWTAYHFACNNPVSLVDPDGLEGDTIKFVYDAETFECVEVIGGPEEAETLTWGQFFRNLGRSAFFTGVDILFGFPIGTFLGTGVDFYSAFGKK